MLNMTVSPQILLSQQDTQSIASFDSSNFLSNITKTLSNVSDQEQKINIYLSPDKQEKTLSIQKPRLQSFISQPLFQLQPHVEFNLGFVIGRNKNKIDISKNKLKRANQFFDFENDQQTNLTYSNIINIQSNFPIPQLRSFHRFDENIPQIQNFSIPYFKHSKNKQKIESVDQQFPFFKKMGKNNKKMQITITKDAMQKARQFFNDSPQKLFNQNLIKPTKIKKNLCQNSQSFQNFSKTINPLKKLNTTNINAQKKASKAFVFDWQTYQTDRRSTLKIIKKKVQTSSNEKSSRSKSKKKNVSNKKQTQEIVCHYQSIRLSELNTDIIFKSIGGITFLSVQQLQLQHSKQTCIILNCLLCNINYNSEFIDCIQLYKLFNQKLSIFRIQQQRFKHMLQQILFKLQKYYKFFPQIINKRLNVSNLLVQMHKKLNIMQKQSNKEGYLIFCLNSHKFFNSIIVEIRNIYFAQSIQSYFVKVSDGWTNVWIIINPKNYLYHYINKFKICSKLFIGYWNHYALSNILKFCPQSKPNEKCIQIWYNSTIIIKQNICLGKPRMLIFYRPLNLNRKLGGLIPTVQGTILRMFTITINKKKAYQSKSIHTFSQHFVEILTIDGYTVLIKFMLKADCCLAELFRLYFKYQFYFLKIGTKDNHLHFHDQQSKFYQVQKSAKQKYPQDLVQILKQRYINLMKDTQITYNMRIGNHYDIKMLDSNMQIILFQKYKFIIEVENEEQITTRTYLKKQNMQLYQQLILYGIQKQKNLTKYILKKVIYSNILKSLPIVYQKLSQL